MLETIGNIGLNILFFSYIIFGFWVIFKGREIERNRGLPRGCGRMIILIPIYGGCFLIYLTVMAIVSIFQ